MLGLTAAMAGEGRGLDSPLRHLYLAPALWAALRAGASAGGFVGLMAGLFLAPVLLPAIERAGAGAQALDGLVALGAPGVLGVIAGQLRDQAHAGARRLESLLEIQRRLTSSVPLPERLDDIARLVRACLGAHAVALVVQPAEGPALVTGVSDAVVLSPRSAAAWSLATGEKMQSRDLEGDPRLESRRAGSPTPVRALVLPLTTGEGPAGVLAVEWHGELTPSTAAAAEEMALHLALGIENARLTLRQRHFAAELEDKVEAATRRLRAIDRAKSEFISVVSHELRTPITALEGFSELLLSRPVPPERARRFLGHIHAESRRLGRIVAELLDLSRLEAGVDPVLKREPLNLAVHVERQVELFAGVHPTHRFHWVPEGPLPVVRADPDAIDRVLQNLLSNAVKYSPGGGAVRVEARVVEGGGVEIAVADEGIGIPADALPRVFDKYVRIPGPETTTVRGLGLGLSLVRSLVEAHGGRIDVSSEAGKGSSFRLVLPP